MEIAQNLPFWGATGLYAFSWLLYLRWFRSGDEEHGRVATSALAVAVAVHLLGWVFLAWYRGFGPPTGLGETLSLVALSTALLYLYLEQRTDNRGLGPMALLLVVAIGVKASSIGPELVVSRLLRDTLFGPHASAVIVAFTAFTLGAVLSVAYLVQYRQLRGRRPGMLLRRLPSLQALDAMTRQVTRVGFVFLGLGLVLGSVLAKKAWGAYWSWDPKQCVTLLTWILYGAALFLRRRRDWQGERVAAANLFAYSTVLLGLLLLQTVFHTAHHFGVEGPS